MTFYFLRFNAAISIVWNLTLWIIITFFFFIFSQDCCFTWAKKCNLIVDNLFILIKMNRPQLPCSLYMLCKKIIRAGYEKLGKFFISLSFRCNFSRSRCRSEEQWADKRELGERFGMQGQQVVKDREWI